MASQMTTAEIERVGGVYDAQNGDTLYEYVALPGCGEHYAVQYVSVWTEARHEYGTVENCIGVTIGAIHGPVDHVTEQAESAEDLALYGDQGDLDWAREQDWAEVN